MQLQITNSASVSREILTSTGNNFIKSTETPVCCNNIKDIGKMIVMSGTAKRSSEKMLTSQTVNIAKNPYRESFLKLRAPFYKSRQKQVLLEEKLMNKSCEMLFEYLKPFKNTQIIKGNNAHKRELNKTVGGVLKTTNIIYQKTATRKVEILSIFEENPNYAYNKDTSIFDFLPNENNFSFVQNCYSEKKNRNLITERDSQMEESFSSIQKTVSSEDFITNALLEPKITLT